MTTRVRHKNLHLFDQISRGYAKMATAARYRPAAPGDGCGSVLLDDEQLRDPEILEEEARRYATAFCKGDDAMNHEVFGCVTSGLGPVQMLALEAATLCNGSCDAAPTIRRLLEMALAELKPRPRNRADGELGGVA